MAPSYDRESTELLVNPSKSKPGYCVEPECRVNDDRLKRFIEKQVKESRPKFDYLKLIAMALPVIITLSLWLISIEKRVSIIELKQNDIIEMKQAIQEIQRDLNDIKGRLIRIESRSNL